jgi:hypothetical protein
MAAPKVIGYYYIMDGGDGEVHPQFFKNEADCQAACDAEEESYGHVAGGVETLYDTCFATEFVKEED